MKILFLDDDETRHQTFRRKSIGHDVTYVYCVKDAIRALDSNRFDVASLDHDLGGKQLVTSDGVEPTGYLVAKHIATMSGFRPKEVIIHSYNQVGARNMKNVLDPIYRRVHMAPFGTWFPNKE